MVVGREEGFGADAAVDVFDHGPGEGEAIVGGGAAPDLIEHNQAARGGGVEDHGGFSHLDHEGGPAAGEIVGGPDASKYAIDDGDESRFCGHERTHLRQDDEQGGLAKIGGFSTHIRAGDDKQPIGRVV